VLETNELHDYRDLRSPQSNKALLLREADLLEFLGMIGMAREFARCPKDGEICQRRNLEQREGIRGCFSLPRKRGTAHVRLERMEQCLTWLEEESLGVLWIAGNSSWNPQLKRDETMNNEERIFRIEE
jgi:hypothetical protein